MIKALTSSTVVLPQLFYRAVRTVALLLIIASAPFSVFAAKTIPVANSRHATAFASTISSFAPASGAPGTLVTVTGTGFTAASTLIIGGKPAIVTSFTATQIVGMVMPGAITGKVTVNTGDGVSSATNFTVTATPYPSYQQGAKLIDTAKRSVQSGNGILAQQGSTVALSADGNTAIVSGLQGSYYNAYLLYTRANGRWSVTKVFSAGVGSPARQNDVALSADGNTVLIGKEFGGSGPAMLYKHNNNVWTNGETLNDSTGSTVSLSADGKTAILGRHVRGGNYGGGGYSPRGVTIMKFINNTWQAQALPDVPADSVRYAVYHRQDYDENGEPIPYDTQYYYAYTGVPGNRVTISADGKTAASVSFGLYGRYNYVFQIPYTVIYALTSTGWAVQTKLLENSADIKLSADGNTFISAGAVYFRSGGIWTKQEGVSGTAMSADGNTVLSAGEHLMAFTRNGTNWTQREVPVETPPADDDQSSGGTCALSADGSTAFFGLPGDKAVAIYASNGTAYAYAGSVTAYGITPFNPLDHATAITFLNTTATTTTLSWPRGDGTTNRAVFLKMGTNDLPAVINGTTYAPDSSFRFLNTFTKGSVAATGWYCVYNGKGGYVNITGLKTGTTYTASVVDYTGAAGAETYHLTDVTASITTQLVAPNYPISVYADPGKNPATMVDVKYVLSSGLPAGIVLFVKDISDKKDQYGTTNNYTETPLPGTASYAANNKFGAGGQIGQSGWFCVYNGAYSQDGFTVTGLQPGAIYRIAAIGYNGSNTNPVYTEPGYVSRGADWKTASFEPPTEYATALTFSKTTETSSTLTWVNGNGALRAVFIKTGTTGGPSLFDGWSPDAQNPFTQGSPIFEGFGYNSEWYCVYNGTGNSVNLLGLSPSTTYRVAVVDYNTGQGRFPTAYIKSYNSANVTTLTPASTPSGYATALAFTNTTGTSTKLSWTNSNGSARAVFIGPKANAAPLPADYTTYLANAAIGSGTQLGTSGWYCVYNGSGSTINISNLLAGTTYRAEVIEYNGNPGSEKYNTTRFAPVDVTTLKVAPTVQASAVTFTATTNTTTTVNWTNGNGIGRAVFISNGNSGAPVPADVYYSSNNRFTSGNQIGTTGWYCIYNGTGSTVNVVGLIAGQTYRVAVVEYSGSLAAPKYLTTGLTPANVTAVTPVPPPVQASGVAFSNTTSTTTTVNWVAGNGSARAVFILNGNSGAPAPANAYYSANTRFGSGNHIGSTAWYCIYNGTGTTVNVIGLTSGQTYRVAVVEYNGTIDKPQYITTGTAPANLSLQVAAPTGYATGLAFSNTTATTTTFSWVNSNGAARVAFVKLGNGAFPVAQATTYSGNAGFGVGAQVGTSGWYCVYNGTGNTVNITGLSATSTYRAIVIEYNGAAGNQAYNLSRYNAANVTTTAAPIMLLTTNQKRMLVEQDVLTDDANTELKIHQGMSPNTDGVNDVFTIDGIGAYPDNTVQIMNSNGELVYTASGYNNYGKAFDGHAANGTLQKAGTYFYSLEYRKGAEVVRKTGYLVIKY